MSEQQPRTRIQPDQTIRYLLRIESVKARTGMARSSIYAAIKTGDFPASIPLYGRVVAWDSLAVDAWIHARINAAAASA